MVWDLRNARAPEKVCSAVYVLKCWLTNYTRYSQVMRKACFRSRGVSKMRTFFCQVAKITVRFAGTHKLRRSLAKCALLSCGSASHTNLRNCSFPQRTTGPSKCSGALAIPTCWLRPFSMELLVSTLSNRQTKSLRASLVLQHLSRMALTYLTTQASPGLTRPRSH